MNLELYYPLEHKTASQRFGQCAPSVCDFYKKVLKLLGHNGIDFFAMHGTPVRAAHDGIVTFEGEDGSAGYGVVVRTTRKFKHASGEAYYKTIYWHLCTALCHGGAHAIPVKPGQLVKAGDIIGYANNTGKSTDDHLHFGLKPVLKGEKDWEWLNADQNNGFKGAIDPDPFFNGKFAKDVAAAPKASAEIERFAAELTAKGNTIAAKQMYALAAFLRVFGN